MTIDKNYKTPEQLTEELELARVTARRQWEIANGWVKPVGLEMFPVKLG